MSDVVDRANAFLESLRPAARARVDPKVHARSAPEGYRLKGVSTFLDGDGNVRGQWVKTQKEYDDPGEIIRAFKAMVEASDIPAREVIPAPPPMGMEDLLSVYAFGDPHIGALAWALESGDDFDLAIAEKLMVSAVDKLAGLAPPTKKALIVSVGDLIHTDGLDNQTTKRGHVLDCDSRLGKIMRVAMSTMFRVVDRALELHDEVECKLVVGNHDGTMSYLFPLLMAEHYRNNPRVVVDTTPSPFMWYRFGKCLFGINHGDRVKLRDLGEIMACDRAKDWGETEFRHFYTGHWHHLQTKELRGVTVESLRTLAAKDAWHSAGGYRSGRGMILDVWHKDYGHRTRHTVGVAELRG